MIELSNSKKTYLGKIPDGRDRWSLDASIGAIRFRENDGVWQDIDPSIEASDSDGFSLKFTQVPYLGRIANDSRRRIYPDRTNLDCWIEFQKPFVNMPAPTRSGRWFYWNFPKATIGIRFDNTSIKFGFRLKTSAAPTSITIPFQTQGITRQGRLLYHDGEVIAELRKPIATDANGEERECGISFGTGEVTISLDTTGLTFPIEIDPTLDLQVGAGSDDCRQIYTDPLWTTTTVAFEAGYFIGSRQNIGCAARFLAVTIPAGSTITLAQLKVICRTSYGNTEVNTRLRAEANVNPLTFSTGEDFDGRTWTTAYVNWDNIEAWTADIEYTSPNIKTCIQEVIDLGGWSSGNPVVVLWDDFEKRSTQASYTFREGKSYDASTVDAPKLHIEYTVGGVTHYGAATLSGTGTLASIGRLIAVGKATLAGVGTLAIIGQIVKISRFGRSAPRSIPSFSRSNIQVAERHNIQEANRHNIQESKR